MQMFGVFLGDAAAGPISWFRTTEKFLAGAYIRGRGSEPNVYVEESAATLLLKIGGTVDESEHAAQASVTMSGVNDESIQVRMADKLTDELIARLSDESDSIWENNPHWLKHLKHAQN